MKIYTYTQTKEITDLDIYPNGYKVPAGYVIVKFDVPKRNEQFINALASDTVTTANGDERFPRLIVSFPRLTLNVNDKVSFTAARAVDLHYCGNLSEGDVVTVPLWQLMEDLSRIGYKFLAMNQLIKNNQINVL